MTEDKNSFVIYKNWAVLIANLPTEQAGMFMQAICAKELGIDYEITDQTVKAMFAMVESKLEEDDHKYASSKKQRKDASRRRWNDASASENSNSECETMRADNLAMRNDASASENSNSECETMQMDTVTVTDTVTDTGTENVTVTGHPTDAKKHIGARTPQKDPKHKYGQFNHVLLTDNEYKRLVDQHGEDETKAAIQEVDDYCEQKGRSYKNYYLTILKWGFRAASEHQTARSGTTERFDSNDYLLSIINGERSVEDD